MANDSFTETSSSGWFSRIGNSIKGILFGLVLIVGSAVLLFWNEGRSVDTRKSLDEGAESVVSVSSGNLDDSKDGDLVHMTGAATATMPLSDSALNVSAPVLKLRRSVETYQWNEQTKTETKKKLGGGEETTTTYSYVKDWSDRPVDSSKFKKQAGHENPPVPLESEEWTADPITVGAYSLSPGLARQIGNFTPMRAASESVPPEKIGERKVHVEGNGFYLGEDPGSPMVGDARVSHEVALPGDVSLISKLSGNTFEPFAARAGRNIEMLDTGIHSPESMFEAAQAGNLYDDVDTPRCGCAGHVLRFLHAIQASFRSGGCAPDRRYHRRCGDRSDRHPAHYPDLARDHFLRVDFLPPSHRGTLARRRVGGLRVADQKTHVAEKAAGRARTILVAGNDCLPTV